MFSILFKKFPQQQCVLSSFHKRLPLELASRGGACFAINYITTPYCICQCRYSMAVFGHILLQCDHKIPQLCLVFFPRNSNDSIVYYGLVVSTFISTHHHILPPVWYILNFWVIKSRTFTFTHSCVWKIKWKPSKISLFFLRKPKY